MARLNRRTPQSRSSLKGGDFGFRSTVDPLEERVLLTFDPTSTEQLMLYDTNRVRIDPQGELNNYLFTSLSPLTSPDSNVNFAMGYFSVNTTQFLNEWSALVSTAPLAWNSSLYNAAAGHNAAMIAADQQSHQVSGEPALDTRIINAGYTGWTTAAENVYAYAYSEFYGHSGFLIDWGNATPGHRDNIMDSSFNEVGISITPESNGATQVGPLVITQDFGARSIWPQMVGVIYNDINGNSRYDSGEGLSNVNITITGANGTFTTTSMTAGGWQKDVPAGTYKVVVSGGSFSGSTEMTVTLTSSNKQVDFVSGSVGGYVNFIRKYPSPETLGVVRSSTFYFDANNSRTWDGTSAGDAKGIFGNPSDIPISGDFNGDGYDEIGVFRNGYWYIDMNGDRAWSGVGSGLDVIYNFGIAGDKPVVGDWNGDGFDSIGVVRNANWYLDLNGNGVWNGAVTDGLYSFGAVSDTPIVGDWNGDRIDDIGVVRSGYWYLDLSGNRIWGGLAGGDTVFSYGNPTDTPIVGDWNYDRIDDVGIVRNGLFYLDQNGNRSWSGVAGGDAIVSFGATTDRPLIGRWKPEAVSPTYASFTATGPTTNTSDDVTFQATHAGVDGNYVSVAFTESTNATTSVSVTGNAITVRLAVDTGAYAGLTLTGPTTNTFDNLVFTAASTGVSGNNIAVVLTTATNSTTAVSVSGSTITVAVGYDTSGSTFVGTASEAAAAISTDTAAAALVSVVAADSGTGVLGTSATTHLSGGWDSGAVVVTASAVAAAISANTAAASLVTAFSGGTSVVGTFAAQFLSGGSGVASLPPLTNYSSPAYIDLGISHSNPDSNTSEPSASQFAVPLAPLFERINSGTPTEQALPVLEEDRMNEPEADANELYDGIFASELGNLL
ncbi:MAG: hypothetical protein KDA68_02200 [Planctomycetaceae bacterium]|nr:hypothetical protein [Planctomycetaceae bacterium]